MTNRQSNIIFYTIISLIICALIVNYTSPNLFEDITKSKVELSIEEAVDKGEHKLALSLYQQLVKGRESDDNANNAETAAIYEGMAIQHSLLGNKTEERNHFLKSLKIKEQLKKTGVLGLVNTYEKLGSLAEEEEQYDQAQMYFEKSLSKKLGTTKEDEEKRDDGIFVGMQNTREQYLRLNNESTIATFLKLGEIHNIKQEYVIAKKYYEKALAASKLTSGEDDTKTLEIINIMNRLAL